MRWTITIAAAVIAGLCVLGYLQSRSLWLSGVLYSRLELRRALKDLQETGGLRDYGNKVRPFIFTNSVTVGGTNHQCAVAYDDAKFYGRGFLAATTNYVFIYLDRKRGPRLIPAEGTF
jgi:hypothetical protein